MATGAAPLHGCAGRRCAVEPRHRLPITTHTALVVGAGGGDRHHPPALRGVIELARSAAQIYPIAPTRRCLAPRLAGSPARCQMCNCWPARSCARSRMTRASSTWWSSAMASTRGCQSRRCSPISGCCRIARWCASLAQVDGDGFIVVDQKNASSLPGLFAAGDVTTTFGENIPITIGDGARRRQRVCEYILAQPRLPVPESAD